MAIRIFEYNKLVRDKTVERMKAAGECTLHERKLKGDELVTALKNKIVEEAHEVAETTSLDELKNELADIMEAMAAIATASNFDFSEIEKKRVAKKEARGGFDAGVYISTVEIDETNPKINLLIGKDAKYPELRKKPIEENQGEAILAPDEIYKIVPPQNFDKNNPDDCVVLSPLDVHSQFIHAAYGRQVPDVLKKFFRGTQELLVLELAPEVLQERGTIVREEANTPGGNRYVHLYGNQKIPLVTVKKIFMLEEQPDGSWKIMEKRNI